MAQKRLELAVRILVTFLLLALIPSTAAAEDGHAGWLRYAPLESAARTRAASLVPDQVVTRGDSPQVLRARDELIRGIRGMVGRDVRSAVVLGGPRTMVIGTTAQLAQGGSAWAISGPLGRDGYAIETVRDGAGAVSGTVIAGESDRAVLYGVFAYLRKVALGQLSADLRERSAPLAPVRWLNHWDNLDGTIERGYGGRSIFWEGGRVRDDLSLVDDYGRLLASLGINGLAINSVNANPLVLTLEFLPQIKQIADVLRPWGVQAVLAGSISRARRRWGSSRPTIRSIRGSWTGGRTRSTPSTPACPISRASYSRRTRRAGSAPRRTSAPMPMPPT